MNRHVFFSITACVVTGMAPLVFTARRDMLLFVAVCLAALYIQVYWRDIAVQFLIAGGHYAVKKGNREGLKSCYQRIYRLAPHSFAGKMAMGVINAMHGNWRHAESCFRQALYLRPGNPHACLNLAVALVKREHYQEVIKLLGVLLYAHPRCAPAYQVLAEAYYHLGNAGEARKWLLVAQLIDRNNPEITRFLRLVEQEMEDAA